MLNRDPIEFIADVIRRSRDNHGHVMIYSTSPLPIGWPEMEDGVWRSGVAELFNHLECWVKKPEFHSPRYPNNCWMFLAETTP